MGKLTLKKITKADFEDVHNEPIENYYAGIKADTTKERYTRILRSYLMDTLSDIIEGKTFEEKANSLVLRSKKDPRFAMNLMLNISKKLRKRTELETSDQYYLNPSSFKNDFKPFKKLFDMNEIALVWKKIYSTFPEIDNTSVLKYRGYTLDEIRTMLEHTINSMEKAIVLVSCSSGIRPQAFDFTWEDVMPVYRIGKEILFEITESQESKAEIVCAVITIYKKSFAEIPAFITPEAYQSLMNWKKEYSSDIGRDPKLDEPVFKKKGPVVIPATTSTLDQRIVKLLKRAGIIKPHLPKGKRRSDVPQRYGFRYFFNKQVKKASSEDSTLAELIKKEYMMDHTGLTKLDRNYFKTNLEELVDEYLQCVPNLTINESLKLSMKNEAKDKIIKELESEKDDEIDLLKSDMKDMKKLVSGLIDEIKKEKKI